MQKNTWRVLIQPATRIFVDEVKIPIAEEYILVSIPKMGYQKNVDGERTCKRKRNNVINEQKRLNAVHQNALSRCYQNLYR